MSSIHGFMLEMKNRVFVFVMYVIRNCTNQMDLVYLGRIQVLTDTFKKYKMDSLIFSNQRILRFQLNTKFEKVKGILANNGYPKT